MNGRSATCNKCGLSEPQVTFGSRRVNGKKYKKHVCSSCSTRERKRFGRDKEKWALANRRYRQRAWENPKNRAKFVLRDITKFDKKRGFQSDLDLDAVKGIISCSCTYCGETELKIGLDRIDNGRGHMRDNVVAACPRCNYLRRDMPYRAWLMLVPSVRLARESGAFHGWDGFGRKRNGDVAE
jgi:hypothetical protein